MELCPDHAAAENLALLLFGQVRGKEAAGLLQGHFHDAFGPIPEDRSARRELPAAEATAESVAAGLRAHGTVLLRDCYAIPALAGLAPHFRLLPDQWGKPIFQLSQVPQAEVEAALITPLLRELVPALGLDLASWVHGSWVRAAIPSMRGTAVPFHQDMLVCARKCMNVWIPIDPCGPGTGLPGLELVAQQLPGLLQTTSTGDSEYAMQHMEIPEATVRAAVPEEALWRPRFRVGDALLFLGSTVHRTLVEPGMDRLRVSIELRFFETR
jgi:hypothetical protein